MNNRQLAMQALGIKVIGEPCGPDDDRTEEERVHYHTRLVDAYVTSIELVQSGDIKAARNVFDRNNFHGEDFIHLIKMMSS